MTPALFLAYIIAMIHYDAIVVGTGAGGAPLAYGLSQKGYRVLIIEVGPEIELTHLGRFWSTVILPGYYHHMAAFSMSVEGTIIYHSKNVGGSVVFSCGNMVRSCEGGFSLHGIDLESYILSVEKEIGVSTLPEKHIVRGTRKITNTAQSLNYNMMPARKGINAEKTCNNCGNCNLGCHTGYKWDTRFYISEAQKLGATLLTRTKVKKVLLDRNGQAVGVQTAQGDKHKADRVILAAGALNTPVILQNSIVGKKSRIDAGNQLFIDAFNVTYGVTENLTQQIGPTMGTVYSEDHAKNGIILSPYLDHWSQMLLWSPGLSRIRNFLAKNHLVGIMTKVADELEGKIFRNGLISKKLTAQDKQRLATGARMSREILLAMGTKKIVTTTHPRGAHPGGSAAIGSVVEDGTLEVKGTQGLYICDASVIPGPSGLPPILTLTALAKWLSSRL